MTRHPFEFVLTKFVKPMGITRSALQEGLNADEETLDAICRQEGEMTPLLAMKLGRCFGISPELLMMMQITYELEQTCKTHQTEIDAVKPLVTQTEMPALPAHERRADPKLMLLATVNNSIGNLDEHYAASDLESLFYSDPIHADGHYAIRTLFTEATLQEFVDFITDRKIPFDNAKAIYHYHLNTLKGQPNAKFKWFFE